MALDIASLRNVEEFKAAIDQMMDEIRASKKAPNSDEILVRGEQEYRNERYNRRHGKVVGPGLLRALEALLREYEISPRICIPPEDCLHLPSRMRKR